MNWRSTSSLCMLLLLWVADCSADYLKVSKVTVVKAKPEGAAQTVSEVKDGAMFALLDTGKQSNGYYHVESASGGYSGWVYRTFVRRFPGAIPAAQTTPPEPLSDPTYRPGESDNRSAARHLRIGKPQAVFERAREGYVLAQDARLKIPLWVQYELTRADLGSSVSRSEDFRVDTSIPKGARAEMADYLNSGFDRGHMAPAEDMSRTASTMSESFLLSNMAPQVGVGFNRGLWKNLEAAIRGWVQQRGRLTVITGPVFVSTSNRVEYVTIGKSQVAVPTHFFKIVVDTDNARGVEVLAFLMPNRDLEGKEMRSFLTSIEEIENLTGLDFLSALPREVQRKVESAKATEVW